MIKGRHVGFQRLTPRKDDSSSKRPFHETRHNEYSIQDTYQVDSHSRRPNYSSRNIAETSSFHLQHVL